MSNESAPLLLLLLLLLYLLLLLLLLLGCGGLDNGEIEVMLHRRCLSDDGKQILLSFLFLLFGLYYDFDVVVRC